MSEFAHDAVFSNLEITNNIIHNGKVILDLQSDKKTLYVDSIITSNVSGVDMGGVREITGASLLSTPHTNTSKTHNDATVVEVKEVKKNVVEMLKYKGVNNFHTDDSITVGGRLNEANGTNGFIIGGQYNESTGENSGVLGGVENKVQGRNSIAMGQYTNCEHDNSFIINSFDEELETTTDNQFMIGCENTLFRLPKSNTIHTNHIPEGFACWCWDEILQTVIMKTKQNNIMYKTIVPTEKNEIKTKINCVDDKLNITLFNPDKL